MICIKFTDWNWSIILTILNIIVTIIVPYYIYSKWNNQKKYEVISNSASIILKEILILREDAIYIYTYYKKDDVEKNRENLKLIAEKSDFIESELKAIGNEIDKFKNNNNRIEIDYFHTAYKSYIQKTNKLRESIGRDFESATITNLGEATNNLSVYLSKLKFYSI